MNVTIKIETDDAAFSEHSEIELARILRELAERLEHAGTIPHMAIRDSSGNTVGALTVRNHRRDTGGFEQARGCLPMKPGDDLPEVRIRKTRDDG